MFEAPTLWGLLPVVLFIVLVFRGFHPVAGIFIAVIVGAIMSGDGIVSLATEIRNGLGSFLAYVGLIVLAGAGLGKIAEKTGAAQNIVRFIMYKLKINTPNKAIIGTMICSMLLSSVLGTLAGANSVIAPIIIPLVASLGISSSVIAIIFQGAGTTGLFLGPFTPPMVTIMELTGLSYGQILVHASIPLAVVVWITTFVYCKRILPKTIITNPYTKEDLISLNDEINNENEESAKSLKRKERIGKQSTYVFVLSLLTLITYGIVIEGGSTYAIFIILTTAILTGIAGRLSPNELVNTFFEGTKPLVWLFFLLLMFNPFIEYVEKLGGFESLANLMLPLIDKVGQGTMLSIITALGVAGIPGATVAQMAVLHEMFGNMIISDLGIPMTTWVLILLVGSQMTEYLYPIGDSIGAMGIARSMDLKNMVVFGIIATVMAILLVVVLTMFI